MLLTAVGEREMHVVESLRREGINVKTSPSHETVFFENIYHHDQDYREQNVLAIADPITLESAKGLESKIFHLGPLLLHDIPVCLIEFLAGIGQVSLDIQGFLRSVVNSKVLFADWSEKGKALPYITYLKANEFEMEIICGTSDPYEGAKILAGWGVTEVIITLGSKGSIVYCDGCFTEIQAFKPKAVVDATGCGDTYMAGYLYKKIKGAPVSEAGAFGAAMATLKIESSGPFAATLSQAEALSQSTVVL
jgi:sugar/nucleoside kinase (ribokinase family)